MFARNGPSSRVTADSGNANADTPMSARAAAADVALRPSSSGTPVTAAAVTAPARIRVRREKRLSSTVLTSACRPLSGERPELPLLARAVLPGRPADVGAVGGAATNHLRDLAAVLVLDPHPADFPD